MPPTKPSYEQEVFDLQTGVGHRDLPVEQKHFFDVAGFLVLKEMLAGEQISEVQRTLAAVGNAPPNNVTHVSNGPFGPELHNVIELGGAIEQAMALGPVIDHVHQFVWGSQYRLVASRAIFNTVGAQRRLSAGGRADPRRYIRYRCHGDGQFRCLMITCLIALHDTITSDGAFCAIPGSHKANLPNPYGNTPLDAISSLREFSLAAGSAVLLTESLSYALQPPRHDSHAWLVYQYGPSYMLSLPHGQPSPQLLARTADDPVKSHLLLEPYYHPAGSQRKMSQAD